MFIDLRTYNSFSDKLRPVLNPSQEQIQPLQTKYCGTCIFYSTPESGSLRATTSST